MRWQQINKVTGLQHREPGPGRIDDNTGIVRQTRQIEQLSGPTGTQVNIRLTHPQ